MKDERLEEFMQHVSFKNDKIAIYENKEKGLSYPLTSATLLCRVDYLELESNSKLAGALEKAKFEGKVENKDYTIQDIEKLVPKSDITKNDNDKYTLTKKTCKGAKIYNVSNQIGIINSYEDKDQAFKLCNEINDKVLENL